MITKEYLAYQCATWTADHAQRVWFQPKGNTFPESGSWSIVEIKPREVISVICKIKKHGDLDVARRVLLGIRRIFQYVIQTGHIELNSINEVTTEVLQGRTASQ